MYLYVYVHIYAAVSNENGSPGKFFLNLFTVCSMWKRKFVVCLFVDKETNRSYKRIKRTKWTERSCPSLCMCICICYFLRVLADRSIPSVECERWIDGHQFNKDFIIDYRYYCIY